MIVTKSASFPFRIQTDCKLKLCQTFMSKMMTLSRYQKKKQKMIGTKLW